MVIINKDLTDKGKFTIFLSDIFIILEYFFRLKYAENIFFIRFEFLQIFDIIM